MNKRNNEMFFLFSQYMCRIEINIVQVYDVHITTILYELEAKK